MSKLFSQANLQKIVAKLGMPGIRFWHAYVYYRNRGKCPNFSHPTDLSEMILASMHKKEFLKNAYYADKWKVREYIKSKGLGDILLDVYGAWEKAEDIDFDALLSQTTVLVATSSVKIRARSIFLLYESR